MRSTTVAGARRAAAAGHAPEAERVGNVPAALRRAIWSADVQQSTAAVSAAFWDKMVPAHNASLMQVAHSSLRGVVLFRHQVSLLYSMEVLSGGNRSRTSSSLTLGG